MKRTRVTDTILPERGGAGQMAVMRFVEEEPKSGVNYKLSGDELVDLIKKAVKDNEWQFTMLGRGSIVMRRDPRDIRRQDGREVGALA
jgi:hypothetical protein